MKIIGQSVPSLFQQIRSGAKLNYLAALDQWNFLL